MTNKDKEELRGLYPELSEKELSEAHETLTRYAELIARIVERRHNERRESNGENGVK